MRKLGVYGVLILVLMEDTLGAIRGFVAQEDGSS